MAIFCGMKLKINNLSICQLAEYIGNNNGVMVGEVKEYSSEVSKNNIKSEVNDNTKYKINVSNGAYPVKVENRRGIKTNSLKKEDEMLVDKVFINHKNIPLFEFYKQMKVLGKKIVGYVQGKGNSFEVYALQEIGNGNVVSKKLNIYR